ncbi:ankyrin repeat-containing protein BDA1-like [Amaranthus tricolor]|uniref:ankyrin repeat-containing protein BDA1-like n=1 Tax=Amaranthus tricolor TaxID=29722 RepID=UPI00258C8EA8|nr:ankyrin repeat-containing protein BDA1-like [Amaranthus tricolor]XP_057529336.1 ankyrin repeat-containing protein BDA1-like [Amaranthus tricolor]XP_057529337.1 ankyrin repeat-containing protein BDA1-like [Amaranthus tricolor]
MQKMEMLFQMAQRGDVEELNQLLIKYPLILHQIPLISIHNPLHIASALGHLDFAKKLLELKPEFARQLDAEGYSPMHLACANGHVEIVREFIKVDPHICRLEGREGKTPLHVAVLGGRVVELREMLTNCEGCIEDVTVQKENCFHLAVKNFQCISFQVLLDWAREMRRDEVLNRKDEHGNTILHLAVWKKQRQVLEMLLTNSSSNLEVNAINNSRLTALDLLLIFPSEAGDREIQDILQGAGALKSQDLALNNTTSLSLTRDSPVTNSNSLIEYFRFHDGRDSPSDVRTTLLVIAVLVVTATYQVGISPPGDVWQDDDQVHLAGTSILGTHNLVSYILLVSFNSIGFNVSLYMIGTLTRKFPLQTELQICLFALYVTFNVAVTATSPKSARLFTTVFTSALPTAVPVACGLLQRYGVMGRFRRLFRICRRTS